MTLEEKIAQIDNRYIDGRITLRKALRLMSCRLLARRVRYGAGIVCSPTVQGYKFQMSGTQRSSLRSYLLSLSRP